MDKISSINPATLEIIDEVSMVMPEELPKIIDNARKAQAVWEKISIKIRKKLFKQLIEYIAAHIDEIAKIIHQETGKPRIEAVNSDILAGMTHIRFSMDTIEEAMKPKKIKFVGMQLFMSLLGRSSYILPKPVGIVGIISPWNFPFGIPFSQTVMAIAVGNAVILKPSSNTALTGLKIQEIFDRVGFPKNLIQTIPGSGSKLGNALVTSGIDRVIFTGSVSIGKQVMEKASQRLTPVVLELGDKSPMVIFDDVDLDRTVQGAVWGCFVNAGQVCAGTKRIYLHQKIYDEFLTKFKLAVEELKQGWNWDDPEISIGPVITENALKEMEENVRRAIEQGAKVLTGGKRNPNLKGYFFEPTVIVNATQDMDVVQKEIFGPIVVVLSFSSEEEAVTLANNTEFGLHGSVWTSNKGRAKRVAEKLTMGTVVINNLVYTYGLPQTPWGGNRSSGFGRTHSMIGFTELLELHHVHRDKTRIKREPWWYPYNSAKLQAQLDMIDILVRKKYLKVFSLLKNI